MTSQRRLLAVDDEVDSAELIVRVAERCGYEGFATADSRGVMNLANALKPDLISVDICMPNIDANELFGILADTGYQGEVLIVSGQDTQILLETKANAEALGLKVKAAEQKPLDYQALRELLSSSSEDESHNNAA